MIEYNSLKILKKKLLIVEGTDEKDVFEHWLAELGLKSIQILPIGGKDSFKNKMPIFIKDSNFSSVTSIGIIRDADNDAISAFQSVCSVLRNCRIQQPIKPLLPTNAYPKVNIFIASDDHEKGSIESLFLKCIKEKKIMECVNKYFDCVYEKQGNIPSSEKIDIAKIYVYLAANQSYLRKRFGNTVKAGEWDLHCSELRELEDFLKQL